MTRDIFSTANTQRLLMQLEASLARAQARRGTVPQHAADAISASAAALDVTPDMVDAERERVGHPLVSLINAWSAQLQDGAGEWLHYGATTQDMYDTVQLLQMRQAAAQLIERMRDAEAELMRHAASHKATPMIGRTVGRHALPMTFGLKVASWLTENRRNIERLKAWVRHTDTGALSGAVGTYAALGEDAFALEAEVMADFGVGAPLCADWKGSRDMHAEFGSVLAIAAQTWRKIAQEVFLLQGDDIRELGDPGSAVGSSTMPHKSNPGSCRAVIVMARRVPQHAAVLLDWMVSIHERDQISSADTLADIADDADQLMQAVLRMVRGLVVLPDNMRANLARTNGQVMAEPAMFALGQHVGKKTAHSIVGRAAAQARENGQSLIESLCMQPEVIPLLDKLQLQSLLDPTRYTGLAPQVVERTLNAIEKQRARDEQFSNH